MSSKKPEAGETQRTEPSCIIRRRGPLHAAEDASRATDRTGENAQFSRADIEHLVARRTAELTEENEVLQQRVKETIKKQFDDILLKVMEDNRKLRDENQSLKEQLQKPVEP